MFCSVSKVLEVTTGKNIIQQFEGLVPMSIIKLDAALVCLTSQLWGPPECFNSRFGFLLRLLQEFHMYLENLLRTSD